MNHRFAAALVAPAVITLAVPAAGQAMQHGLSALDLFDAAATAQREQRYVDAVSLYDALIGDPDTEIRIEARFRKGLLLSSLGRNSEAAVLYRAILDERPSASAVRLELAKVLALLGDEAGARRSLRQAQAAGLPPDVAAVVDQFAAALRSTRSIGGSFEGGVAPDSNINRATSARTLDTIIAPLVLSDDARARSGIGVQASGQVWTRLRLSNGLSALPRVSGSALVYGSDQFDDVAVSALAGLEWTSKRDRVTPSAGRTWRWYGGKPYATTDTLAVSWLHPVGRRAQLTVAVSAARADYKTNSLQSGGLYDFMIGGEYALSPRAGIGVTLGATRQAARDPGYATAAGSFGTSAWRDLGRTTIFGDALVRRTEGDARLFLFPERRREWFFHLAAGATLRWLTVAGFAPVVRIGFERNISTVGLYDYSRMSTKVGVTRAW